MTSQLEDPRLAEAKALPIEDVVNRLGIAHLRRASGELVGPCPVCGGAPNNADRFAINLRKNLFQCRKCDVRGGDQVALVMQILSIGFREALQWLCDDAPALVDPDELGRRRQRAEADRHRQENYAERARARARRDAMSIWEKARPGHLGVVRAYLRARGIDEAMLPEIPRCLRFIARHPYVKKIDGQLVMAHTGPAMIAAIRQPGGAVTAVHQTWVDPAPPHGKARLAWNGEALSAKMVRGSKKAGSIRLHTPRGADTLVMGEGIETTLTAMVASAYENAAYWAGIDLGNMAGRMRRVPGMRHSGLPDMEDAGAFMPPEWCGRLVYIMDGDSEPKMTRAKLECGLKRAMQLRPGLRAFVAPCPPGKDLNDVLVEAVGVAL